MTPTYNDNPDYDIDNPPAGDGRERLLRLTQSVRVDSQIDADAFGGQIAQSYKFFTSGQYAHVDGSPCWITVYESIDAIREEDGRPLIYSESLALKTKNNDKWLGEKQAPDILAKQFQSLGVTASWNKAGQPDSAVGRVFSVLTKHKPGTRQFDKTFRVWPVAIMPVGFTYDGEVRSVGARSTDDTEEAAASSPSVPTTSDFTLSQVATMLVGTSPRNAIDTLMDNRVPGIVEGVPVLDAAFKGIDELIAALGGRVKVEDGYFT